MPFIRELLWAATRQSHYLICDIGRPGVTDKMSGLGLHLLFLDSVIPDEGVNLGHVFLFAIYVESNHWGLAYERATFYSCAALWVYLPEWLGKWSWERSL